MDNGVDVIYYTILSDFLNFAMIYLRSSRILIESVPPSLWGTDHSPIIYASERAYIIPAIYCFHHSIELLLKGFDAEISQTSEVEKTHDIRYLFEKFEKKYKKTIENKTKQIAENLGTSKEKVISSIKRISGLQKIVIKYYQRKLITSRSADSLEIEDTKNELYRYPEASGIRIKCSAESMVYNITKKDIEEILKDLDKIEGIIHLLIKIISVGILKDENLKKYDEIIEESKRVNYKSKRDIK